MVKNSRLGPPPSMAGSTSNLTFNVFLKSKFLCLNGKRYSLRVVHLCKNENIVTENTVNYN